MAEPTKYDSPDLAREADRTAPQALEHRESAPENARPADDADARPPAATTDPPPEPTEMAQPDPADLDDLTAKQRAVLAAIRDEPEATQGELAERFDVTRATISRWVNDIPGFEWADREAFVARHLEAEADGETEGSDASDQFDQRLDAIETRLEMLAANLDTVRERLDELDGDAAPGEPDGSPAVDPARFAKIVRACVADDRISQDEEEAIIEALRD